MLNIRFAFLLSLLQVLSFSAVAWTQEPQEIAITHGWVTSAGRASRVRESIPKDLLELAWSQGKLNLPNPDLDESPSVNDLPPWKKILADANGAFSGPDLAGGWLATYIESPAESIWLLDAQGHGMVRINGTPRFGDVYSNGSVELPVLLRQGSNELLFSGSRGRIAAKLKPASKPYFLSLRDTTFPHILRGEAEDLWGSILLVNATNAPVTNLTLRVSGKGFAKTDNSITTLVPLSVTKIPFRVQYDQTRATEAWDSESVVMTLELLATLDQNQANTKSEDRVEVKWDTRSPNQHHRRTFVSRIDGSVQYYGVVPPSSPNIDSSNPPDLFLALHGAGVEGEGHAATYAQKPNGYVIAPTNRRAFGFDWEDWGRLDALEVLELASKRFRTNPRRTYLTGHSMGGHGTWHIGSLFPDRFAALGPSAGWISFASYAGMGTTSTEDPLAMLFKRTVSASETLSRLGNLATQGIYILHGDADDNVPVDQARTMRETLSKFHPDFVYKEQPGAGHWWGNACCDWKPMFDFFSSHELPRSSDIARIKFITPSPGVSSSYHWCTILCQQKSNDISSIDLNFDRKNSTIVGETQNVQRLSIDVASLRIGGVSEPPMTTLSIKIDNSEVAAIPVEGTNKLWFERTDSGWKNVIEPDLGEKGPHRYGSFKEAFRNRFVLVYGTKGSEEENAWMLARARFDAETFRYRGNGYAEIVSDTSWQAIAENDRNLIVYGNSNINSAWSELLSDSPVNIASGNATIQGREPLSESLCLWMVRPRPGSSVASVGAIGGTDLPAMLATQRLPIFSSGTGYPDLLLAAPTYLEDGFQSIRLAGYFGVDWSFERGEWYQRP